METKNYLKGIMFLTMFLITIACALATPTYDNGIIASYNMDTSSNLIDETGNKTVGTTDITLANGEHINNSFNYSSATSYTNPTISTSDFNSATEVSISMWIKPTTADLGVTRQLFGGTTGGCNDFFFQKDSSDRLNSAVRTASSTNSITSTTGELGLKVGVWTHIGMSWKKNGQQKIIINGTVVQSGSANNENMCNPTTMLLGAGYNAGKVNGWTGLIDAVTFWDTELNNTQWLWLYYNGTGTQHPFDFGGSAPSDNFSITITNKDKFNASVDGIVYSTTTGIITTPLLENSTTLHNITIETDNYFNKSYTDYNISTDIETKLYRYPVIKTYNKWNGSRINTFNVTIDTNTFSTTNGSMFVPYNTTKNVKYEAENYVSQTTSQALNQNTTTNITKLYQSQTTIWSKEITTNNLIDNWTLTTEQGSNTTTTGSITIFPNLGTYYWNWSNIIEYFNKTLIAFTIDEATENLTASGFYARNITFKNALGIQEIYPTCTQNGQEYNYPYYMPKSTATTTCALEGYQNKTLTLQGMPDENQYNMTPTMLWLIFSEQTQGYVETEECVANTSDCSWFNATNVYIQQSNLSTGRVVVKFNPDGSGNWQQIFEYDNDGTHIKEYIEIITPDLVQNIKVTGEGTPLEDARVTVKTLAQNPDTNETDWITVYSDFTSIDGIAVVLINDENTYKFCAQKEGYETTCMIDFIPPSSSDTILIDLEATESEQGYNFIGSSCPNIYTQAMNCTIEINTYQSYNTICLNFTGSLNSTTQCYSDSVSATKTYTLTNTTGNVTIEIYLDGTLTRTIKHKWLSYDPTNKINWESETDQDGITLLERIKGNTEYQIAIYIILTIIGVAFGFMADKYFNGYGIYGSAIWFTVLAFGKLYIFWIPVVVIGVYAIIENLVPLFTNK